MTDTTKQKIKIFISYGHKESQIFKKVVAYLREKGYEVWFDESSIRGTDDWRQEIVEGIRASQTVIAGLSHDFLKEDGVCSEEMGIALAVKSNRIFTIYLDEKEDLDKIPSTLTRTQYINLSDWKEYIDDDQAFDKWFKKEFQPIIEAIESKDNKEFSGQINTIRHALRIPEIGSNKVNSYLMKKYTKRPWIDEELEKWRDDPQGEKLGVIIGKQGTGKSHYAARRCHTDYRIAANFFCEYNKENFSTSKSLIRDLSFQLACQIPDFRSALLNQLESIAVTKKKTSQLGFEELVDNGQIHIREDYTEEEEFDTLIVRPFSICIDGKMETHLILIDALDEAGKEERSRLIDIIVNHLERLPRWIRILILTRPEADIKPYLEDAFEIDIDQEINNKDIEVFLQTSFENQTYPNKNEIIDTIVEKSQGTFLYAELVAKEILGGRLSIEDIDKLPKGLARYFSSWFKRIYPVEKIDESYKEKDRKAIAMILASPGALPTEELRNLLGWNHSQTNDFVKKLENYLIINVDVEGKETIEIAHKYMSDWLLSDLAGDYKVYKEDGLSYIYKGIEELYMIDKTLDSLTRYEKLNLIDALKNQRGQKALKDFLENEDAKDKLLKFADEERENFRLESASKLYEDMIELYKRNELKFEIYKYCVLAYTSLSKDKGQEEKGIKILEGLAKDIEIKKSSNYNNDLGIMYNNIGSLYKSIRSYKEAEKYYKKAINIQHNLIITDNSKIDFLYLAYSYNNLGSLYNLMQDYKGAEAAYKKAIDIFEQKDAFDSSIDRSDLAMFYNNIGVLYNSMESYEEAEGYFIKAIEIFDQEDLRKDLKNISYMASAYNNLGFLYDSMKSYDKAAKSYKKAIDLYTEIKESRHILPDSLNLASSYYNLGYLYDSREKLEKAEKYYKKAINLFLELTKVRNLPNDSLYLARTYINLGSTYDSMRSYSEAQSYYKKAASILIELKALPSLARDVGFFFNELGVLYYSTKSYEEAERYYKEAIDVFLGLKESHKLLNDKLALVKSYNYLGALYYSIKKYDKAKFYCEKANLLVEEISKDPETDKNRKIFTKFHL